MDLSVEIEKLRREISVTGSRLVKLGKEKGAIYQEKKSVEHNLSNSISAAKELKAEKSAIDKSIKEKKRLRAALNKDLKELSSKLSILRKKNVNLKVLVSAKQIKRQIEAMEYAIETEGLPFEKEKHYMSKIKILKQKLSSMQKDSGQIKEFAELREKLLSKKSLADKTHKEVQELAKKSASLFAKLTKKAEDIAELKKKRSQLQQKLRSLKSEIDSANAKLSDTLNLWLAHPAFSAEESILNKFKNAKRLTKEDILKLQKINSHKAAGYGQKRVK